MKSTLLGRAALALLVGQLVSLVTLQAAEIQPPGQRPQPLGAHALVGGRVIVKPGTVLEGATILIRDGRIEAVQNAQAKLPADARVWAMKGKTIYAGFIDPYLSLGDKPSERAKPIANRWTQPIDARAGVSFTGVPTTKTDMGAKGPGYEIAEVHPEQRVAAKFSPDAKAVADLRALGFTAANFIPTEGIYRGTSTLALLGEGNPNGLILKPDTLQHLAFGTAENYPKSLMGVIAVVRQTVFDAQHYFAMQEWAAKNPNGQRPEYNPALEALRPVLARKQSIVIETGSVLMLSRAKVLAAELEFQPILVATGQEWRRPALVRQIPFPFIVPVVFPAKPDLPEEDDWEQISLDQLRAWDWAPEIPALLRSHQRSISLTTHGLADRKVFRKNIARAIERGLKETDALAALTTEPAALLGASAQLGTIEKGKLANLTIVDGESWFDPKNEVSAVWVEGRYFANDNPKPDDNKDDKKADEKKKPELPQPRIAKTPGDYRGALKEPKSILIKNATIWTCGPKGVIKNGSILFIDGKIIVVNFVSFCPRRRRDYRPIAWTPMRARASSSSARRPLTPIPPRKTSSLGR